MSDEQQSARALGRDPSGDIGTRAFFDAMGSEWVSEGIDDGADICASLHKHFANKFTATKVKLLRAKCNDVSMREALRLADVEFSRWAGLIDTLADHLALDFVTPPPHRCENIPSANSTISTCEVKSYGGIRESKYLDKGGDTLSSDLLREGRLWEKHLRVEDFTHLQLPLLVEDKHVSRISTAAVEAVIAREMKINWGQPFEEAVGRDLLAIFGDPPQRNKKLKRERKRKEQLKRKRHAEAAWESDDTDDEPPRTWRTIMHWKSGNLRKSSAKVCSPPSPPPSY